MYENCSKFGIKTGFGAISHKLSQGQNDPIELFPSLIEYGVYAGVALLAYSAMLLLITLGIHKCVTCCANKDGNSDEENGRPNTNGI